MAFCTAYGTILHIKELNGSLGKCLQSHTECQTEISLICVFCAFFFSCGNVRPFAFLLDISDLAQAQQLF